MAECEHRFLETELHCARCGEAVPYKRTTDNAEGQVTSDTSEIPTGLTPERIQEWRLSWSRQLEHESAPTLRTMLAEKIAICDLAIRGLDAERLARERDEAKEAAESLAQGEQYQYKRASAALARIAELERDAARWRYGAKHGFPSLNETCSTSGGWTPWWYYKQCAYETPEQAIDTIMAAAAIDRAKGEG